MGSEEKIRTGEVSDFVRGDDRQGRQSKTSYRTSPPAPPDAIVAAHAMCMGGEEKGSTLFWRAHTQRSIAIEDIE